MNITVGTFEERIQQILVALQEENIYKILLFGSVAEGNTREDSDIDLLVVLDSDYLPKTYKERMEYRLQIQRKVRHIAKKIPIDMLIYTRREYELLTEDMNSFLIDIHTSGRLIYEKPC